MSQKISKILSRRISRLGKDPNITSAESLYLNASREVIKYYVGIDVSLHERDPFFDAVNADMTVSHIHMNRVTLLAESLFLIRGTSGFLEFCQRIKERTVRSSFFEMLAAKQFYKAGFELKARPEIGIKGKDFDFSAVKDEDEVNVEVTALTAEEFSESTVYNALSHKRSQLPSDKPSVIYCVFPPSWVQNPANWNSKPKLLAEKFFKSTRRVNAVTFWAEKHLLDPATQDAMLGLIRQSFINDRARFQVECLDFLKTGQPASNFLDAFANSEGRKNLNEIANSLDFYRWVENVSSDNL